MSAQSGILAEVPRHARYLSCTLSLDVRADDLLQGLKEVTDGENVVLGLGQPLVQLLGSNVSGLDSAPVYSGAGIGIP